MNTETSKSKYGEFVDSIERTGIVEARLFIKEWKELTTEEEWKECRPVLLTLGLVMDFCDDAVMFFQERLAGTYTEEVYAMVKETCRDFLQEICKKAAEFGITIDPTKFLPLTPTEAISQISGQTSTSGS